jgi:BRCT domain type II-containing protein
MANKKEEQMKILPNEYERNVVNRSTKLYRKGERSTAQNTTKKSVAQNTAKMSRTVANDKSRQNPDFLSSVAGYSRNVVKEYKEWRIAQPKSKNGKATPEAGQFYGALLQGRRYK